MKKTLTLLALCTLVTGVAFAADTTTEAQKATPHSAAASLATYEKVARENETLKAEVARLTDVNEELKSQIAYQSMMSNMLLTLKQQEAGEKEAELEATLAYDEMMGNMLAQIRQASADDKKEEWQASIAYHTMMENMFRKIAHSTLR